MSAAGMAISSIITSSGLWRAGRSSPPREAADDQAVRGHPPIQSAGMSERCSRRTPTRCSRPRGAAARTPTTAGAILVHLALERPSSRRRRMNTRCALRNPSAYSVRTPEVHAGHVPMIGRCCEPGPSSPRPPPCSGVRRQSTSALASEHEHRVAVAVEAVSAPPPPRGRRRARSRARECRDEHQQRRGRAGESW